MNYSFNCEVAKQFGVDEAIIIENLYFWIAKNKANEKHFHDGEYWTYNSVKAFAELFPFWTTRQIERITKNLETKGAIKTGNYNKSSYDRTKWYSLTEKVYSIYANKDFHFTECVNQNTQSDEPIPDINTDSNTNINLVWDYYSEKLKAIGKSRKKTNEKIEHIRARLSDKFTVDELKTVLDKVFSNNFMMGKNDRNKQYIEITNIFSNATKVEQWLDSKQQKEEVKTVKSAAYKLFEFDD